MDNGVGVSGGGKRSVRTGNGGGIAGRKRSSAESNPVRVSESRSVYEGNEGFRVFRKRTVLGGGLGSGVREKATTEVSTGCGKVSQV